jgi:two-component system, NtrC family, sensor kinase
MRRAKPSKAKVESKRPAAPTPRKSNASRVRDLEERLAEALEQQTATAEILRVIASSPTEYQPVFDTIVRTAGVVCGAVDAMLWTIDGAELVVRAHHGPLAAAIGARQPVLGSVAGCAVRQARVVHVEDLTEADDFPVGRDIARRLGWRTTLSAPLLRDGAAIGAILIRRSEMRPFSDQQIALLQTFADQAVIAIENVRLFTELQASNHDLTEALDQQTATGDILRVISRSQTDLQPVFDTILTSAVRLLRGYSSVLTRIVGHEIKLVALTSTDDAGDAAVRASYPQTLQSAGVHAEAIRHRMPLNIADTDRDARMSKAEHAMAQARGNRSWIVVPMLHYDDAVGTIVVTRREAGGFTEDEIALLQTFADQAVIAIENTRLLSELQARTAELTRSVEQLTALGDVGRAVSSSLDLDTVLSTIVGRAVQLSGTDGGTIFEYDENAEEFMARATLNADEGQSALLRATRLRRGEGAVGQMAVTRQPIEIADIAAEGAYESRIRGAMLEAGTRSVLAIPLLHEERLVGGLVVTRRAPGAFTAEVVELLRTFATQSALAIQNARLFRELADKSRQLEAASQHKSEFLANMSHELRTPLNAIIGFSEVLSERMFGELNEKQDEYLKDIHASGQHLLSLINDILDLSKIEAGKMELELADFDLPMTIENALMLVRERAARRGIELHRTVDERLGHIQADERKVRQVLLNLLSNAIKFTPEGGRIEVGAKAVNGLIEVSVTDTGVGIAPEDQEAVFEEFRQVGTADKKVEGTGLGLALSRKFIELHGGKIWVKSHVGAGSTFTFTVPVRHGE